MSQLTGARKRVPPPLRLPVALRDSTEVLSAAEIGRSLPATTGGHNCVMPVEQGISANKRKDLPQAKTKRSLLASKLL